MKYRAGVGRLLSYLVKLKMVSYQTCATIEAQQLWQSDQSYRGLTSQHKHIYAYRTRTKVHIGRHIVACTHNTGLDAPSSFNEICGINLGVFQVNSIWSVCTSTAHGKSPGYPKLHKNGAKEQRKFHVKLSILNFTAQELTSSSSPWYRIYFILRHE